MKAIAIIPARGGSKRLPRKNILPLGDKPMLAHPITAAKESGIFDRIIVSTEDQEITEIATSYGAQVISRPDVMATDTAHESEAYAHVLKILKQEGYIPDAFCGIYATAAFILPEDLQNSAKLLNSEQSPDVIMGVSEFTIHPYKALQTNNNGYLEMVYPVECKQRSQFYPHYVASNGTFYWFKTASFQKNPEYYQEKLVGYEIPNERAIDIDTKSDYDWACTVKKKTAKKS